MPKHAFSHVRVWVFDLDNTLYPPSARLFDQIKVRMTRFVMQALDVSEARATHLREEYWRRYGTTLAGLMREHDVDPGPYLDEVHDISLDHLRPAPDLCEAIAALPGRKVVYTNGPRIHAERVVAARGLATAFDALYGVEDAGFLPKPEPAAFQRVFQRDGIDPKQSAMFEDDPRNLEHPHDAGMKTVLVGPFQETAAHIHHQTEDLPRFLSRLAR